MKFLGENHRSLMVNYKKLQVFRIANMKVRIQHNNKFYRLVRRKKKSSWGMRVAKLNDNQPQITAYWLHLSKCLMNL